MGPDLNPTLRARPGLAALAPPRGDKALGTRNAAGARVAPAPTAAHGAARMAPGVVRAAAAPAALGPESTGHVPLSPESTGWQQRLAQRKLGTRARFIPAPQSAVGVTAGSSRSCCPRCLRHKKANGHTPSHHPIYKVCHRQVSSTGAAALLIALVNEIMANQSQSGAGVVWSGVRGLPCAVTTTSPGKWLSVSPGAGTATGSPRGAGGLSIPARPRGAPGARGAAMVSIRGSGHFKGCCCCSLYGGANEQSIPPANV